MKLFYREYGRGDPLIILHGLYGSSDNWVSIALRLSANFRVILPDLRNHGRSGHDPVHSYVSMAEDLAGLAKDLNLHKFYLAGHSMGGKAAIYFAMRYPERIQGLSVIDISPFEPEGNDNQIKEFHLTVLREMISLNPEEINTRADADKILSVRIKSEKIRAFLLKNLERGKDKRFRWKINPGILLDNLDNIMTGISRNKTEALSGFPVIFIRAGNSGYIPETDILHISRLFPSSEIISADDTSHWIHAENPDLIVDMLNEMAQ